MINSIETASSMAISSSLFLFSNIKGTAMNKARARVWLQSTGLHEYGFGKGERCNIELLADRIVITANEAGKRVVSGKIKPGANQSIFDICMPPAQRDAMFGGSEQLDVYVQHGLIIITAMGAEL